MLRVQKTWLEHGRLPDTEWNHSLNTEWNHSVVGGWWLQMLQEIAKPVAVMGSPHPLRCKRKKRNREEISPSSSFFRYQDIQVTPWPGGVALEVAIWRRGELNASFFQLSQWKGLWGLMFSSLLQPNEMAANHWMAFLLQSSYSQD